MSEVRRAIMFSSISTYSVRLIGLALTVIVARLLTPAEIGTYAIASALVMIVSEVKLMGAGDYIIREAELTDSKIRAALGLTMMICWSLGAVVLFLGPFAGDYYDLPPLNYIFWILVPTFFIAPFVSIPFALLARQFNFKVQMKANLIGTTAAFIVTVSAIKLGFSYYSLAFGQLASAALKLVIVWHDKEAEVYWKPNFCQILIIAKFGINNSLANFFKKIIITAPDMVIGKMGTTTQVGMFSRGLGFVDFLSGSLLMGVAPVALPYLSESKRSGDDLFLSYTRATVLISALVWPILAVASVASLPVIRLFFGDQWDEAAPITAILALWCILSSTHHFFNHLLIATGHERFLPVKEGILVLFILFLLILVFPFGLKTVAQAFLLLGLVELLMVTWILSKKLGFYILNFYQSLLPSIVITLVCAGTTLCIDLIVPFDSVEPWKPVSVIALVLPVVWLVALRFMKHPLLFEIFRLFKIKV
ncbi:polysaccharide biosynthesis protein [Marinobacter sp. Z-F4-2]|nr:polysaccharide biosynthesis protein [Marinobacter sp. Z-F4-2]